MQSKVRVDPPRSDRIGPKLGTDSPTNRAASTTIVLETARFHVKSTKSSEKTSSQHKILINLAYCIHFTKASMTNESIYSEVYSLKITRFYPFGSQF